MKAVGYFTLDLTDDQEGALRARWVVWGEQGGCILCQPRFDSGKLKCVILEPEAAKEIDRILAACRAMFDKDGGAK